MDRLVRHLRPVVYRLSDNGGVLRGTVFTKTSKLWSQRDDVYKVERVLETRQICGLITNGKNKICRVSGIVYRWVQGLGRVPDVPRAANVSFVTEGSGAGVSKEPPVNTKSLFTKGDNGNLDNRVVNVNTLVQSRVASNLSFTVTLADQLVVTWDTILANEKLYVEVPAGILPEGSKESLVCLLEYAEERLRCSHVILCFRKNRTDKASLVRAFMFMGFSVACPGEPLVPNVADLLYMVYTIDPDD